MKGKFIIGLVVGFILASIGGSSILDANVQDQKSIVSSLPQIIESVDLNKGFSLAGEFMPDNFDTRERLDRELSVNAYWHSSTLLNIKSANRFFPTIEKILSKNGVPDDFKYCFDVPEVQLECQLYSTISNSSCDGNSIHAEGSGSYPPFEYEWNDGTIGDDLVNVPYGQYAVTVTDAIGCTNEFQHDLIPIGWENITDACPGVNDGIIQFNLNNFSNFSTTVFLVYGRPCSDCNPYQFPIVLNETSSIVSIYLV